MRGIERDSRADVEIHRDPVDKVGLAKRLTAPRCKLSRLLGVNDLREENRELVAAEAREQRPRQAGAAKASSYLNQNCVAAGVAERIVDCLETVEIKQQYRGCRVVVDNLE